MLVLCIIAVVISLSQQKSCRGCRIYKYVHRSLCSHLSSMLSGLRRSLQARPAARRGETHSSGTALGGICQGNLPLLTSSWFTSSFSKTQLWGHMVMRKSGSSPLTSALSQHMVQKSGLVAAVRSVFERVGFLFQSSSKCQESFAEILTRL